MSLDNASTGKKGFAFFRPILYIFNITFSKALCSGEKAKKDKRGKTVSLSRIYFFKVHHFLICTRWTWSPLTAWSTRSGTKTYSFFVLDSVLDGISGMLFSLVLGFNPDHIGVIYSLFVGGGGRLCFEPPPPHIDMIRVKQKLEESIDLSKTSEFISNQSHKTLH